MSRNILLALLAIALICFASSLELKQQIADTADEDYIFNTADYAEDQGIDLNIGSEPIDSDDYDTANFSADYFNSNQYLREDMDILYPRGYTEEQFWDYYNLHKDNIRYQDEP